MTISSDNLQYIISLIHKESGIVLSADKEYLLETRLLPVARKNQLTTLDDLIGRIRLDNSLVKDVVEALTTNESMFFRDIKPFDYLKNTILPNFLKDDAVKDTFRVLSAACSTGQEPYSIAMTFEEFPDLKGRSYHITAADLDTAALRRAQEGVYSQFEVQRGLPIQMLLKYFSQQDDNWHIKDELKQNIDFKMMNLLQDNSAFGTFDIIFCRNVLIYFDNDTKLKVLASLYSLLKPGGVVFLGASESLIDSSVGLKPYEGCRSVFVKSVEELAG